MSNSGMRTIVLGLDGLDARLTENLMHAGLLPHMKRLAAEHGFRRVISTTPAESGVAWTSFSRGANPGQTNLFDFVDRMPGTYLPHLAGSFASSEQVKPSQAARQLMIGASGLLGGSAGYLAGRTLTRRQYLKMCMGLGIAGFAGSAVGVPLTQWVPKEVPSVESSIKGVPWWDRLAQRGERSVALRIPLTFPAQAAAGVDLLAGLGVPDVSGTQGTPRLITDDPRERGIQSLILQWHGNLARVKVPGPDNPVGDGQPTHAVIEFERLEQPGQIRVRAEGEDQYLKRGNWSSWVRLRFSMSPLVARYGIARLFFCDDKDKMRLYLSPIAFDPSRSVPGQPISSPVRFAADIEKQVGAYHTIGWETQTSGRVNGLLSESAYLTDAKAVIDLNETLLDMQLRRNDWNHLMLVVQATDQISHVFFDDTLVAMQTGGDIDDDHPLVQIYRRADELVGRVQKAASADGCRLVVMSDHGFAPFRRAINLNTWLAQRGWLALKDRDRRDGIGVEDILDGEAFSNVDWFNTRAYALGLAGIYLNVAGREPKGIVKAAGEYEFIQNRLIADLRQLADPQTDQPVFAQIYRRQDIYTGPYVEAAPDLILGLNPGFRVSSSTVVGGIPEGVVVPNTSRWQGDHCGVDASLIPGICLTNFSNTWPQSIPIEAMAVQIWPNLAHLRKL